MSQGAATYTRWAMVSSGEGGGRIASRFITRTDNPGIEDRIVVMNTNRTDIRNTVDRLSDRFGEEVTFGSGERPLAFTFGTLDGAGNDFVGGEMCAHEAFEGRVMEQLEAAGIFADSDAFLYTTTLGGGTGNGSVPYFIHGLKNDASGSGSTVSGHVALAAWPYDYEGGQTHFNAVCGLSRLLRWYDGEQNADMVLLVSNSHVAEELSEGTTDENERVNERIMQALDLMIGAGRNTRDVVDVRDYIQRPSQLDAYHFTPAVETGVDSIYELELMFDKASRNAFVPLEPTSSRVLYAIVRAPKHLVDAGEYTATDVKRELESWRRARGYDDVRHSMASLTPVERADDTVDVLLLFGGFELDPLLERSIDHFDWYMDQAVAGELNLGTDAEYFPVERYRQIKRNLEDYRDR